MKAQEILTTLRQRGATVRVLDGGRLEVIPGRVLDDELRDAIRSRKTEILRELRPPAADAVEDAVISETRQQLGAVLLSSRFGELWIALTEPMAAVLQAEETQRPEPRPVLLPEDLAALKGKSEAAVRAVLDIAAVFPGSRIQ